MISQQNKTSTYCMQMVSHIGLLNLDCISLPHNWVLYYTQIPLLSLPERDDKMFCSATDF